MKTFLFYIGFVIIVNFVGFETYRQLNEPFLDHSRVYSLELQGQSLYELPQYDVDHPEVICMAENLFHEARGEGYEGKRAVALVTINRMNHVEYPNTICEVVYEPEQFSWTFQDVRIDLDNPIERRSWELSKNIAQKALNREYINDMLGVTHYHAYYVDPAWGYAFFGKIGNHLFYVGG